MFSWMPQQVPVVLDALRADRIANGDLTAIDELVWRELTFRFTNKKTGACFPSYATIATHAGCCCRTVGNSIKRLKEAGWLRWKRRWWRRKVPGGIEVAADSNSYEVRVAACNHPGSGSQSSPVSDRISCDWSWARDHIN